MFPQWKIAEFISSLISQVLILRKAKANPQTYIPILVETEAAVRASQAGSGVVWLTLGR